MRKIYIYENNEVLNLEPIVLTRPAFDLRCGAFTFLERIQNSFPDAEIELIVRDELKPVTQEAYPELTVNPTQVEEGLWILGNVLWTKEDIEKISKKDYQFYYNDGVLAAAYLNKDMGNNWLYMRGPVQDNIIACFPISEIKSKVIKYLWDAVNLISEAIQADKEYFQSTNLKNKSLNGIHLINENDIYIKSPDLINPGVVIDASNGPVMIADNVKVQSFFYCKVRCLLGRIQLYNHILLLEAVLLDRFVKLAVKLVPLLFRAGRIKIITDFSVTHISDNG